MSVALVGLGAVEEIGELLRDAGIAVSESAELGPGEPAPIVLTSQAEDASPTEAVSCLREAGYDGAIVMVCEQASPADVRSLVAAGVRGVVLREQPRQALPATIEAVAGGQVCVPWPDIAGAEHQILSIRERQVVALLAMGLHNSEIADRLFLAESTVKSHLSSAFAKLGVRSRHEAIDLILGPGFGIAVGPGWLPIEPAEIAARSGSR